MGGIGGSLSLGAGASATAGVSKPGGFVFGQASQFGGASSLFGGGPAADAGAAAAGDDPYNIPIDLTKIKRTEKPPKTYEEKTSEEKQKAS
jgi:hypothetical protein